MAEHPPRFLFRHRQRLHGNRAFAAVFDARLRKTVGPIVICAKPNALGYNRLGLSVPRRVGNAVARGQVKRRLREAFRLSQQDQPAGYDLIIVVRPHKLLPVAEYVSLLTTGLSRVNTLAQSRRPDDQPPPESAL